jgi:hypothetical protein
MSFNILKSEGDTRHGMNAGETRDGELTPLLWYAC